jgi:tetratricopeptide (TPR) repeat protein
LLLCLSLVLPVAAVTPTRFDAVARQAEAARSANQVPDAIRLYREATRLKPAWSDGWWYLGSLYYDQDRFSEAALALQHVQNNPKYRGTEHAFLGLCEYETGQYDDALEQFLAWARAGSPGTRELRNAGFYHFALLLARDGRFTESLAEITWLVQRLGDNAELTEAMGLASLRMRYLPENYPPELRERIWLAGNAALYAQMLPRQFERADEYAARLESRYSGEPEVHAVRAVLCGLEEKSKEAELEYREELKISPNHVPALVALARMDLEKANKAEAGEYARKAIDAEPNDAEAHHLMGQVLLADGDLVASTKELEASRRLAPNNASVHAHLAIVYGKEGRTQESKAESAAFLALTHRAVSTAAQGTRSQGKPTTPVQGLSGKAQEKTN